MPWNDVQDSVKALKGQLELANPNLVVGGVRAQMDPAAQNAGMKVTSAALGALIGRAGHQGPASRRSRRRSSPALRRSSTATRSRSPIAGASGSWRLSPRERLTPVRIGIWDTGVDMALFRLDRRPGMAFDDAGNPVPNLLRDLGEAKSALAGAQGHDRRARSTCARRSTRPSRASSRRASRSSSPRTRKRSRRTCRWPACTRMERMSRASRSPATRSRASIRSRCTGSTASTPPLPTEERARRTAANYRTIVDGFKDAGVRVVNMSWRYGPTFYEGALAFHGVGKDPAERKAIAMKLFAIERDALKAAFESAPRDPVRRRLRQRGQQRGLRRVHSGGLRAAEPHHRGRRRSGGRGDELLDVRQDRRRARERVRGRQRRSRRRSAEALRHVDGRPAGDEPRGEAVRAESGPDGQRR